MNINGRPITLGAHERWISDLAFCPSGALLASGSGDSTVGIWRAESRERLFQLKGHTDGMTRVAFSPDGQLLVTGAGDGYLNVWDMATGTKIENLGAGGAGVTSLSISATRSLLSVGREDGVIEIYESLTEKGETATLMIEADVGVSVALSADGRFLAASDLYHSVTVWEITVLQRGPQFRFDVDHPFSLAFTADGRYLAVGGRGGTGIWEMARNQRVAYLPCEEGHIVFSLAFDATHNWLISGRGEDHDHIGAVDVWDLPAGTRIATLSPDDVNSFSVVYATAVSHNGSLIASGGDDDKIYLWNVEE